MASNLPSVAVVIPAYRAETYVGTVLAGIPDFVRHIVLVDDASPDDTVKIVQQAGDSRITLVSHATNQGVGGAMLSGYDAAVDLGAEILVKMDGDDQMDPAHLLRLIKPIVLGKADYTKGNRFLHLRQLAAMPPVRRIGNAVLSFLTKFASGYWNVFDPTNGYTAIHKSILPLLDRRRIAKRYFFETSMLLELGLLQAVVSDVYIPARYQGALSSLPTLRSLFEFPPRLLKGFLRRMWLSYFVRDFTLLSVYFVVGTLLALFGLIWGGWQWVSYASSHTPAPTGTVMLAMLPVILGVQFWTQALALDIQNVPSVPIYRATGE